MEILPNEEQIKLAVKTKNNIEVPFVMSLLNEKGKTIWEEAFTAPLNKEIQAYVEEPGVQLRIAPAAYDPEGFQQYGIEAIKYYPNPTSGKLYVSIESKDNDLTVPVNVRIADMNGEEVLAKTFKESGEHLLEITGQETGLYVIIISAGDVSMSDLLEIK